MHQSLAHLPVVGKNRGWKASCFLHWDLLLLLLLPVGSNQLLSAGFAFLIFFFNLQRERASVRQWEGQQGEREKESEADSKLSMEPKTGLNSTIQRSRPEQKPRLRGLTDWATQPPLVLPFWSIVLIWFIDVKHLIEWVWEFGGIFGVLLY